MKLVPDPILRQQAKKINPIPQNLGKYTQDMIETMHDEHGVGLAANQVGSLRKVAVIQLPEWDEALVLINPEIIRREGEREVEEGCLSITGRSCNWILRDLNYRTDIRRITIPFSNVRPYQRQQCIHYPKKAIGLFINIR